MKRVNFRLFALAIALVATSCVKDVVVDSNFHGTPSEKICFGAELKDTGEDTRGGVVSNRVGKHDLKSADGEFVLPMGVYVEDGIGCADAAETRGALFTNAGEIDDFTVWAKHKVDNKVSAYFNGVVYEKNTTDNVFYSNDEYMWPGDGELTFVAVTNAPESGFVPNYTAGSDSEPMLESFNYTVPADATKQNDIVLAKATYSGDTDASAPLKFEHIMTAVNFKVGTIAHGKIKSITLKGVYNTGIYNIDNEQWAIMKKDAADNELRSDYSVPLAGGEFNVDANTASDTFINDQSNGILLMVPQIVGEGATVEIVFAAPNSNDRTLTASIAGDNWDTNKTTNYTISIDEQYNLNITPVGKLLDAHYIIAQVEVTVEGMNDGTNVSNPNKWQLTAEVGGNTNNSKVTMLTKNRIAAEESDATKHSNELSMVTAGFWCDEYVNRNTVDGKYVYTSTGKSARGADQITGTGNYSKELIYILIPENNSTVNRTITLTLQKVNDSKVSKTVTLTQRCPGWTDDGKYGWETVDDDEDGRYGFIFTRKIAWIYVYSESRITGRFEALKTGSFLGAMKFDDVKTYIYNNFINAFGASEYATFDSSNKFRYSTANNRYYIYLDYTRLNNLKDVESSTDGLNNTLELNSMGGSASTLAFENVLHSAQKTLEGEGNTFRPNGWNWDTQKVDPSKDESNTNYSNGVVPMPEGSINDLSGILSYVLKKNRYYLYDPGDDGVSSTVLAPIILESDIKWYIPAYGQFSTFVPNPNITDKNGGTDSKDDYWSSTAGENNENPANALSYNGNGELISRSTELGVIAVRNKDGDTYEGTATIDEINVEDMAGGENGEAQWVE